MTAHCNVSIEPPNSRAIVGRAREISEAVTQTSAVTAQMLISDSQRFGEVESSDMRQGYRARQPEARGPRAAGAA